MEEMLRQLNDLKAELVRMQQDATKDKLSMIVFSGSFDRVLASFIIATGAAAMGSEVSMFFTFWGTSALRKPKRNLRKDLFSRLFGFMLPRGFRDLKLSQMNMGGMGTAMMRKLMKRKNVSGLSELLEVAEEMGVKIIICEMSMDLMGFQRTEMVSYEHLEYAGVASFLKEASESRTTLFI